MEALSAQEQGEGLRQSFGFEVLGDRRLKVREVAEPRDFERRAQAEMA